RAIKAAQSSLGADPNRSFLIDRNGIDGPVSETITLGKCSKHAFFKNDDASLVKAKPHSPVTVSAYRKNRFAFKQRLVRKAIYFFARPSMEPLIRVEEPKATSIIVSHRRNAVQIQP